MRIMLDCSPDKIREKSEKFNFDFWQLRTPLTRNRIAGVPYGLDNGCFKRFDEETWVKQLEDCESEKMPVFVCLPDVVGSAIRTRELFDHYELRTNGLPRALVLQDGIGSVAIPWDKISAVFIGGSDEFKICPEVFQACKVAKMLGKWIHVGRVNTVSRLKNWIDIADSIDGSGLSRFDYMLEEVVALIKNEHDSSRQIDYLEAEALEKEQ